MSEDQRNYGLGPTPSRKNRKVYNAYMKELMRRARIARDMGGRWRFCGHCGTSHWCQRPLPKNVREV